MIRRALSFYWRWAFTFGLGWSAIGFLYSAIQHDVTNGLSGAGLMLVNAAGSLWEFVNNPYPGAPAELADATAAEVVENWIALHDQRLDLAVQRVQLGVLHGQVNREAVILEELIIGLYGGEVVKLSDGRTVSIGRLGCKLSERMRITRP